jgi:hypothetical protein
MVPNCLKPTPPTQAKSPFTNSEFPVLNWF